MISIKHFAVILFTTLCLLASAQATASNRAAPDKLLISDTGQSISGTGENNKITFAAESLAGNIQVTFQLNGKIFLFTFSEVSLQKKVLDSLQLKTDNPVENKKTANDQQVLSGLYRQLMPRINRVKPLENALIGSLDYLLNMIPVNGTFTTIDFTPFREKSLVVNPQAFINTCNQRGSLVSGSFDDIFGKTYTQKKTVGNPASACLGRCGVGCVQSEPQSRKRQYTQQCYAHDLCTGFFGTVLGQCSDEFAAASDDYLNAPNCSFYVVGKWRQSFDWECNGAPVAVTISHFASHRFNTSAGLTGTWTVTGNKIVRTYDNGIKNSGTIAETNMKITGNLTDSQGRSGCFTDSYLTTQP